MGWTNVRWQVCLGALASALVLFFGVPASASVKFCGQSFEADKATEVVCKSLGNESLEPLAQLRQLKKVVLRCSTGQAVDLAPLSKLNHLEHVTLEMLGDVDLSPLVSNASLRHLRVADTELMTLKGLETLADLTSLDLSHAKVENLAALGPLTGLETLDLSAGSVKDPRAVRHLKGLKVLLWSHADLKALPPLGKLKNLEVLDLSGNAVRDLGPLGGLALRELKLYSTKVESLDGVNVSGLEAIDVSYTGVESLAALAGAPKLRRFACSSCKSLKDIGVLAQSSMLEVVKLDNALVFDFTPLSGLTRLKEVTISGTSFSDVSVLSKSLGLRVLEARGSWIVDVSGLAGFKGLEVLNLASTGVVDVGPLAGLGALRELDLSYADKLQNVAPLGQLSALVSLDLRRTGIKDLGGMGPNLSSLEVLNLSSTQVTSLGALHKAKSLKRLVLYGVALKNAMELSRFKRLTLVKLYEGQFPARVLAKLKRRLPQTTFDVIPMRLGLSMMAGTGGFGCWEGFGGGLDKGFE